MTPYAFSPAAARLQKHEPEPRSVIAEAARDILVALGETPDREGLLKTPERMARTLLELTAGSAQRPEDVLNGAVFAEEYDQLVLVRDVEFFSLCEHHLLPFRGRAHLAYLPAGRVVGLSKLARLLEIYARRLQVQERLTEQVAQAIEDALNPRGVAVLVEAEHFCMMMRGVSKQEPLTVTSALRGEFRSSPTLRSEFLAAVQRPRLR